MNNLNKLDELREERNYTKKKIAEIIGVSDSVYARWKNNKTPIPTERLYQLANFYNINIDYLLCLNKKREKIISSNKINLEVVSKRVRIIRNELNLTLRELAKKLNTTSSTLSAYETGKVLILCTFLIEICKIGNYSTDWVLGRTEQKLINKQNKI